MNIYLIRHGEIPQRTPRRFIGQRDLPLTAHGRQQIADLIPFLQTRQVTRLVCSPLLRCRDSAVIIADALELQTQVVPDLCEISLGIWEGLTVAEVQEQFPGNYEARGRDLAGCAPEGGESFQDLLSRVWPAFGMICSGNGDVAVVAHAGVNRTLLCHILGMALSDVFRLGQDYGCINTIGYDGMYRVERVNWRPF